MNHFTMTRAEGSSRGGEGLLDLLLRALREEAVLLGGLGRVLERQREAVAAGDLEEVNASVLDAQRVLLTMGQARLRRQTLLEAACGEPGAGIRALEEHLGNTLPPELVEARNELMEAADRVSRMLRVNDRILHGALAAGRALVKGLGGRSPLEGPGVYAPEGLSAGSPGVDTGLVLDRQV